MSEFCYIGKTECGCIVSAVVDGPEHKEHTSCFVAQLITDGLTVERVSVEAVSSSTFGCKHLENCKLTQVPSRIEGAKIK